MRDELDRSGLLIRSFAALVRQFARLFQSLALLGAPPQLYERICPSVRPSVRSVDRPYFACQARLIVARIGTHLRRLLYLSEVFEEKQ